MNRDEMLAFVARRFELLVRQDAVALARLHAEDGRVHSPLGGHHEGRDAIQDVYQTFFGSFSFESVVQEDALVDGNKTVQRIRFDGTDRGEFLKAHPPGRSASVVIVSVCEIVDNTIRSERRVYDFSGLLVQIGAIKAKPA